MSNSHGADHFPEFRIGIESIEKVTEANFDAQFNTNVKGIFSQGKHRLYGKSGLYRYVVHKQ